MANFKRDRGFGGGKRFSGRGGDKPDMHKVTCSECGINCEVPFKPTGERPVFCSNCFKNQDTGGGRQNKFGDKRREMFDVVCDKCGKDCQVPFRPTAGKPVFCNNCFKQDGSRSKDSGEIKDSGKIMEQINLLNAKIDELIKILTPEASTEKSKKPKVKKEATIKKAVKRKKKK